MEQLNIKLPTLPQLSSSHCSPDVSDKGINIPVSNISQTLTNSQFSTCGSLALEHLPTRGRLKQQNVAEPPSQSKQPCRGASRGTLSRSGLDFVTHSSPQLRSHISTLLSPSKCQNISESPICCRRDNNIL